MTTRASRLQTVEGASPRGTTVAARRTRCTACRAPMHASQEWCLECGTGRTVIQPAGDRPVRLLLLAGASLVAAAAVVIALAAFANSGARASSGEPAAKSAKSAERVGAPTHSRPPGVATWPAGLSGWTVVLARTPDGTLARDAALGLATSGVPAGVLQSSVHPLLAPGQWIVFSGRYPDQALAEAAAAHLKAGGRPGVVVEVAQPGGI